MKFDPRVSVLEYAILASDIKKDNDISLTAKLDVLSLLQRYIRSFPQLDRQVAIFTSPALKVTHDDHIIVDTSHEFTSLIQEHIKNVLVVDSRGAFLNLYARCVKTIFGPHVTVSTASTGLDALELIRNKRSPNNQFAFDVIIMDHRLRGGEDDGKECKSNEDFYLTGSDVLVNIQRLNIEAQHQPLLIGTSMVLKEDCSKLARCGVDYIWGKPPPPMTKALRNEMFIALLNKRGQHNIAIL